MITSTESQSENQAHKSYDMEIVPFEQVTLDNICGDYYTEPVCFWAPRRAEIQRFVEIAKIVHEGEGLPTIVSIGCGNGFLEYLLARTGAVNVIGSDPNKQLIKDSIYTHPNLTLEVGDSKDAAEKYKDIDVVLNSWMPDGLNLTPDMRNIGAKCIIYVTESDCTGVPGYKYSEYIYEEGYDEYDDDAENHRMPNPVNREDFASYEPGQNYVRAFEWSGPARNDVRRIKQILNGEPHVGTEGDRNWIDIQFRKDIPIPSARSIDLAVTLAVTEHDWYAWEFGLERVNGRLNKTQRYERGSFLDFINSFK